MNRKELACAAIGVVLGATACSPAVQSLTVPAAQAEQPTTTGALPGKVTPHVDEVHLTLISGTTRDASSAQFRLLPKSGWSITTDDSRLTVSIKHGYLAEMIAPENEKVNFVGTATISHEDGTEFVVRCHVDERCH